MQPVERVFRKPLTPLCHSGSGLHCNHTFDRRNLDRGLRLADISRVDIQRAFAQHKSGTPGDAQLRCSERQEEDRRIRGVLCGTRTERLRQLSCRGTLKARHVHHRHHPPVDEQLAEMAWDRADIARFEIPKHMLHFKGSVTYRLCRNLRRSAER